MSADETVLLAGTRYATDCAGFARMRRDVAGFTDRVWAIEGCRGIGRHDAQRLLAAGEVVVDVPPKLSAKVRVYAVGQGRKTDATDAHSIALAGTRAAGLRPLVSDADLEVLRMLADRRRQLGEEHTPEGLSVARPVAGADPRRGQEEPVRSPGQATVGEG